MGEYYEVAHSILLTASQNTTLSTENMISVVEILTTIIIGIISCVVTWRLTLRSVNRMELTYYKKVIEILSNSIHKQYTGLGDLKITYSNEPLDNPSLLLLEIGNTGNTSISHPPISIKAKENTQVRIFSGFIQNVPEGYEDIWKIQPQSTDCYNIAIGHMNPKQLLKAVFLLDHCSSEDEISFICPMQDVTITRRISEEDLSDVLSSTFLGSSNLINLIKLVGLIRKR